MKKHQKNLKNTRTTRGCQLCGAPTKLIHNKLICRGCGYFEGCCDGGKQALRGEYDL